jgi:hypothetical protein
MMGWLLSDRSPRATFARRAARSECAGYSLHLPQWWRCSEWPTRRFTWVRRYSQSDVGTTVASPNPNAKKPPGNRVAFSLGRIVPTEARPSELSWRHSMGGLLGCQGQMIFTVNDRFYVTCWKCHRLHCAAVLSSFVRVSANCTGCNPPHLFALTM